MDAEREIATKLAASLDKLDKDEANKNAPPEYPEDEKAPNETPLDPIRTKAQLMEFFDVPAWARNSTEAQQRVTDIINWASEEAKYLSDEPTLADLLRVINNQLGIMGAMRDGNRVLRLWQFTKIHEQRKLLLERERALYG